MPIQVTIEGQVYRTDDLTLDEASAIEVETGESWLQINPFRTAAHCRAVIRTFLARSIGVDEATKRAGALTVEAAFDCMTLVPDDLPDTYEGGIPDPKDTPSTPGSPGPPTDTDGPPT